ncbi:MAG: nucleotide exchange factor GrpE [Hyphomicrobiales bacterium]|nr:nucleotide exchange factor GrpE [Hyphomicrobiales bacterium]
MNDSDEREMSEESAQEGNGSDEAVAPEAAVEEPEESKAEPSPEEIISDLEDKWKRALAELHNVRRRSEEERRNAMSYGISSFARDMLSVCDNLGRALDAARRESGESSELLEGIGAIERELLDVMTRHGVRRMEPLGEKFDPNYHEAVFEAGETSGDFDEVVEVVQSGYMIGERLLRPARVGIARAKSKPVQEDEAGETGDG